MTTYQKVSDDPEIQAAYERARRRGESDSMAQIIAFRQFPGGHENYWGTGFNSLGAAMHPSQAAEHSQWIQQQGLKGVEVQKDGTVTANSPGSWNKYLAARGLGDQSSSGTTSARARRASRQQAA